MSHAHHLAPINSGAGTSIGIPTPSTGITSTNMGGSSLVVMQSNSQYQYHHP
jgi:hypothetical protein